MEPDHHIKIISCRICRESMSIEKVTFELDSEWSRLFEFCFGLQVNQKGPRTFCKCCSDKLRDYGEFKRLSLQSEQMWKSLSNNPNCYLDTLKIVKEENIDHLIEFDDNDYEESLVIKEEKHENFIKKHENESKINMEKNEKPFDEDNKLSILDKKFQEIHNKNHNKTRCYKYGEKKDKNDFLSTSKNKSKVIIKEATDLFCGICDFTSTSSVEVNKHIVQHFQNNLLKCQLCHFEGRDLAEMVFHRYTHLPKNQKRTYECPECSQRFQVDYKLQYHYRSVHLKKKGGLCKICGKPFLCYKKWKVHEREHATTNFICDHCGKGFLQRYKIINHMSVHYNIFTCVCDYCGKGFKKASNLKSHIYHNHTPQNKQETCTICNRKYKNEEGLKKHMQEQHSERKYLCEVCSKRFCSKTYLKKHIFFYHSDEKPYACDLCDAKYRIKGSLTIHKLTHTGQLPQKCKECGKGFSNTSACKRHQSVHTGVRPVKCSYCDRTFHYKKQMYAHCNSKHKDAPKNCVKLNNVPKDEKL